MTEKDRNYNKLRDTLLGAICSVGVTFLGYLSFNVGQLNERIAIVVERQTWHSKIIQENRDEIKELKEKEYGKK